MVPTDNRDGELFDEDAQLVGPVESFLSPPPSTIVNRPRCWYENVWKASPPCLIDARTTTNTAALQTKSVSKQPQGTNSSLTTRTLDPLDRRHLFFGVLVDLIHSPFLHSFFLTLMLMFSSLRSQPHDPPPLICRSSVRQTGGHERGPSV